MVLAAYANDRLPTETALAQKGSFGSYHTAIVPVVAGLASDVPRRYVSAWPSEEALPGFPAATVECALTLVGGEAVPAFAPTQLPAEVTDSFRRAGESERLVVEAALTGSRATFVEALATHPDCDSIAYAEAVVDALLAHVDLPLG